MLSDSVHCRKAASEEPFVFKVVLVTAAALSGSPRAIFGAPFFPHTHLQLSPPNCTSSFFDVLGRRLIKAGCGRENHRHKR